MDWFWAFTKAPATVKSESPILAFHSGRIFRKMEQSDGAIDARRPFEPHPLFASFIAAAKAQSRLV